MTREQAEEFRQDCLVQQVEDYRRECDFREDWNKVFGLVEEDVMKASEMIIVANKLLDNAVNRVNVYDWNIGREELLESL